MRRPQNWTFQDQTAVSFVLILAASVAAAVLRQGVAGRLAFLVVGLGYLIRAVPPASLQAQLGPARARNLIRICGGIFILFGLIGPF